MLDVKIKISCDNYPVFSLHAFVCKSVKLMVTPKCRILHGDLGFSSSESPATYFDSLNPCLRELQPGISSISVWISYMAGHLQEGFKNPILNLCIWCKEHVPLEIGRLCVMSRGPKPDRKPDFPRLLLSAPPKVCPDYILWAGKHPEKSFGLPRVGRGM